VFLLLVFKSEYMKQLVRSTPLSQPNKVGLKCPSARLSIHKKFDFNEIWYVGRGQRVMHDGMQYDPIQGQGHEPFKVGNRPFSKAISSSIYNAGWILTTDS